MKLLLSCVLSLAVLSTVTATAASTEMFPALRKRMAQKLAAVQQKSAPQGPAPVAVDEKETQDVPAGPSAAVPAPLDVGSDGYPQLPAVSQMLSEASGTLKSVSSQASGLEARVVQAQMQSESKMAKQKAAFEEKLKQQEESNQAVIDVNSNITSDIQNLKDKNAAIKKHAKEIEETNKVMRSELKTLQSHLGVAKDFTAKSLTSTDDSKSSLLQVLKGKGSRRHHKALVETASRTKRKDDDDEDDDDSSDDSEESDDKDDDSDDDEEEGTSLLSLSRKVRKNGVLLSSSDGAASFEAAMSELESAVPAGPAMPETPSASPGDLLEVLSKDVAHLAQQEKESEKNLKNLFIRDFRAGAKRHAALLSQQKTLIAQRGSLQTLQAKLTKAEAHLESTRAQLEGRLHGLGQFIQKLAHFAMAPQHEVPHLLEVLPKAVAIKAETKKVA